VRDTINNVRIGDPYCECKRLINRTKQIIAFAVLSFTVLIVLPLLGTAQAGELPVTEINALGKVEVCFTTGHGSTEGSNCAALVAREIATAQRDILVQAYNFTEPHIVGALIAAARRGVPVTLLIDKITAHQKGEGVDACAHAGIAVAIDNRPRIAHNKVMVIDGNTVLTGSFNWSTNAEVANAENLLVVHSRALAMAYAANFARRLAVSAPYGSAKTD
jgi:phosphatidylserine/phosphatidylglycerophosphate/cardiolipin synthase-like enzyme